MTRQVLGVIAEAEWQGDDVSREAISALKRQLTEAQAKLDASESLVASLTAANEGLAGALEAAEQAWRREADSASLTFAVIKNCKNQQLCPICSRALDRVAESLDGHCLAAPLASPSEGAAENG